MTVIWAWADLGNHSLQNFNIRQYLLIASVLSVKKFNPEWKRVFVVDNITYEFIKTKGWIDLWDEIKITNFHNTEYGNLYNINIYSWPKIYSYGVINDDDILILDIDIVFLKKFEIPDKTKVCGHFYDFNHYIKQSLDKKALTIRNLWIYADECQKYLEYIGYNEYIFKQDSICLTGAPVYIPKGLGKYISNELINHIINIEKIHNNEFKYNLSKVFYAIEEEYPLAKISKACKGICCFDKSMYKHSYINNACFSITSGLKKAEELLGIQIYEKYIK